MATPGQPVLSTEDNVGERLWVGLTTEGVQIWCPACDKNVIHIIFKREPGDDAVPPNPKRFRLALHQAADAHQQRGQVCVVDEE